MNADPVIFRPHLEFNRDPNRPELTLQLLDGRDHALVQGLKYGVH